MLHRESIPVHTLELLERLAESASTAGFYLAVGTALSLRFGHRISVDLDFFKEGAFSVDEMIEIVSSVADTVHVVNRSEFSVALIADQTKVEFLRYDYQLLSPVEKSEGFFLCSLLDNSLMKLSAVTGRGAKKDFCDLAEIVKKIPLQQLLLDFPRKYPQTDTFLVMKSLSWFEDAESDPDPVFLGNRNWPKVRESLSETLREISLK